MSTEDPFPCIKNFRGRPDAHFCSSRLSAKCVRGVMYFVLRRLIYSYRQIPDWDGDIWTKALSGQNWNPLEGMQELAGTTEMSIKYQTK